MVRPKKHISYIFFLQNLNSYKIADLSLSGVLTVNTARTNHPGAEIFFINYPNYLRLSYMGSLTNPNLVKKPDLKKNTNIIFCYKIEILSAFH